MQCFHAVDPVPGREVFLHPRAGVGPFRVVGIGLDSRDVSAFALVLDHGGSLAIARMQPRAIRPKEPVRQFRPGRARYLALWCQPLTTPAAGTRRTPAGSDRSSRVLHRAPRSRAGHGGCPAAGGGGKGVESAAGPGAGRAPGRPSGRPDQPAGKRPCPARSFTRSPPRSLPRSPGDQAGVRCMRAYRPPAAGDYGAGPLLRLVIRPHLLPAVWPLRACGSDRRPRQSVNAVQGVAGGCQELRGVTRPDS